MPSRYLEHAPVAIAIVEGAAHIVVYANAEFRRVTGVEASDVLGKPFSDVLRRDADARTRGDGLGLPSHELIALLHRVRLDHKRARNVSIA